jgi:prepilin-type N-terminal cleavage/methylation domain-containing protein
MSREGRGFTLIEVMVALAIGALVILLAHYLFVAVADDGRALIGARQRLDRTANARRWLRAAFLSLDMGRDTALTFDGHSDRVTFRAWLGTADGWFARRTVTLGWWEDRFIATVAPGDTIILGEGVDDVAFDYLLEPGAEAHWVHEWVSPVNAPLAVRLRVRDRGGGALDTRAGPVDTLLFLVKERG